MSSENKVLSHERNWRAFREGGVPRPDGSPNRNTDMSSARLKPCRFTKEHKDDRDGHEDISASRVAPVGALDLGREGARLKVKFATLDRAAPLKLVPGPAWVEQDGRRTPISLLESPSPVSAVPFSPLTRKETGCILLDVSREDGLSPSQFRRVLTFINERISRTVTLSDLAREAGLSAAYFSQRFKSSTGTSPHQYLLQLRVCKAKKLLEASESPVIDIAAECGFQTQQHFARIFRRLTMRTPTEYRRQSQQSALVSIYTDLPYTNDISIQAIPSLSKESLA
jgi:AraC family transcriptional regulator